MILAKNNIVAGTGINVTMGIWQCEKALYKQDLRNI